MKFFIIAALAAVAAAEPEAEAGIIAQRGVYGAYSAYQPAVYGARAYGYAGVPSAYGYAGYAGVQPVGNYYGQRFYKREAEAEPEADAEAGIIAQRGIYGGYSAYQPAVYASNAYGYAAVPSAYGYAGARPYGNYYGQRFYKREAEAEPEADAEAGIIAQRGIYGGYSAYQPAVYASNAYGYAAVPSAYGYAGARPYGNYYGQRFYKREAEAEPEADAEAGIIAQRGFYGGYSAYQPAVTSYTTPYAYAGYAYQRPTPYGRFYQ